jgi:hypothetical protein
MDAPKLSRRARHLGILGLAVFAVLNVYWLWMPDWRSVQGDLRHAQQRLKHRWRHMFGPAVALEQLGETECLRAGESWQRIYHHHGGSARCVELIEDEGKTCTDASDCQSHFCDAPSRAYSGDHVTGRCHGANYPWLLGLGFVVKGHVYQDAIE